MNISDSGGEFALIQRLARIVPGTDTRVVKGIGDDAAVVQVAPAPAPYLLITTDILVEDRHFRRAWSSPEHIGEKAAECNISDIAAMGGAPQWMVVALVLKATEEVDWVEGLYRGLHRSCRRHGVTLLGGDTTQGPVATISITLLGSVAPHHLRLRSHARPGDLLLVTGPLGGAAAALALLEAGHTPSTYLMDKHRTPHCRMDVAGRIACVARAMIDISDGLGSEVHHICEASQVGAEIDASAIPLHPDVLQAARTLGCEPLTWALSGGEDFELLFSIAPERMAELEQVGCAIHPVGRITARQGGVLMIDRNGRRLPLPGGYDHFSRGPAHSDSNQGERK
ncbi:MAG: thiamine-phosphate kinase [Desulfatitalea sp.]|nr:thiamine-phosphate kinase [Desulfatitalea sp.]